MVENVIRTLEDLYEQQQKLIDDENYIDAEKLSQTITDFKKNALKSQKKKLELLNKSSQEEFEEKYKRELDIFNQKWIQKEKDLNDELLEQEMYIKKNQKNEINQFNNAKELNIKPRQSPQYLNLKKIQFELARQERFKEAEVTKKMADKIQKEENDKLYIELKNKYRKQYENLLKRHKEENKKFKDEKERRIYLQRKEKDKEYDSLINKYRSMRVEMEIQRKEKEMQITKKLKNVLRKKNRSLPDTKRNKRI
jgi:hypothetical protein